MIRFRCPHCQSQINAPPTASGKSGTCTACKRSVTVPTALPPVPIQQSEPAPGTDYIVFRAGPGWLARFVWLIVFLVGLAVCGGIGIAGWVALTQPVPEHLERFRLLAGFVVAAVFLVPAYIAARALDRMTQ